MKLSPSLPMILLILAVLNIFAFFAFQTPSFLFYGVVFLIAALVVRVIVKRQE